MGVAQHEAVVACDGALGDGPADVDTVLGAWLKLGRHEQPDIVREDQDLVLVDGLDERELG